MPAGSSLMKPPHFGQMLFHFIRLVFPHRSHSSWPSRIFQSSLIGFSMMWWQSWQINASRKTAKPGPNDNSSVSNPHLSHINIADAPISKLFILQFLRMATKGHSYVLYLDTLFTFFLFFRKVYFTKNFWAYWFNLFLRKRLSVCFNFCY